jgi:hypothetical protein
VDVPTTDEARPSLVERARPVLRTAFRIATVASVTLAINVMLVLIAIPIGFAVGHTFVAVLVAETAMLTACLGTAAVLAFRSRRRDGVGVMLGWALGYVGLLGLVVAVIIAVVVVLIAVWVLVNVGWWLFGALL